MPVYFVTGKLGSGKSLSMVGRMRDYLLDGRIVATNIDLRLENLLPSSARKVTAYRLPDKPTVDDLNAIGVGNESYDEGRNGGLFLDECGTWFNSRNWQDKSRQPLMDWMLHARKKGWDVYFLVQDISLIDKQAREALAEHVVWCRRLDRMPIPFLSPLIKLFTGYRLLFPRIHFAIVKYGDTVQHLTVDRWVYRGSSLYSAYDTKQIFIDDGNGIYSYLSPWHLRGRYAKKIDFYLFFSVAFRLLLFPYSLIYTIMIRPVSFDEVLTVLRSIVLPIRGAL